MMDDDFEIIPVEIPRALYESKIENLIGLLLALSDEIDEKGNPNEIEGNPSPPHCPLEVA
jgi:hypothetical protein